MAFSLRHFSRAVLSVWTASLLAASSVLAMDRTSFPIRIFIEPVLRDYQGQEKSSQLPEAAVRTVRQGFLDWVRVLLFAPGQGAPENYTVILHRQEDEQRARLLLNAGVFTFVERRDQADLVVEAMNRPRTQDDADGITGRFSNVGGLRVGKIEVVFRGSLSEYPDEFSLRSVVMHEAGHALGLAHLSDQKCNLMAPKNFTCNVPFPVDCRAEAAATRCVGVSTEQVQFVQRARAADAGAGPRSPMADIRDYRQSVVRRVRTGLVALTGLKAPGRIVLKLGSMGQVEEATVESSFGSAETDARVLEGIRDLGPFGAFPATWKDPTLRFSFTLGALAGSKRAVSETSALESPVGEDSARLP